MHEQLRGLNGAHTFHRWAEPIHFTVEERMTSPCDNFEDVWKFSAAFDVYLWHNRIIRCRGCSADTSCGTPGLADCSQLLMSRFRTHREHRENACRSKCVSLSVCLASYFSRLCRAVPMWMKRGPATDVCLGCSSCLTGDHNGSWHTPGFHVLYLCFDPGFVQPHCFALEFKLLTVGCQTYRILFEKYDVVSVVEVRDIFISVGRSPYTNFWAKPIHSI